MRDWLTKSIFSLAELLTISKFTHRQGWGPWSKFLSDCQLQGDVKVFVKVRIDDHRNMTAMGGWQ